MKALLRLALAVGGLFIAGQASAIDNAAAEALAQKSGCLVCHTVDTKIIGPAFKDVAAKYKGDKSAEAKLIAKVKNGAKVKDDVCIDCVWGPIAMKPNSPRVSDADIKTLVDWVLTLH